MAIKQTEVTVGKQFKVIHNKKLKASTYDNDQVELEVMGEGGCWFDGHGPLPVGTVIEVVEKPNKRLVGSALTLLLKIVDDPKETIYSCFWIYFKKRVEEI